MDTGKVMVTQNNRTIPTGLKMYGDCAVEVSCRGLFYHEAGNGSNGITFRTFIVEN